MQPRPDEGRVGALLFEAVGFETVAGFKAVVIGKRNPMPIRKIVRGLFVEIVEEAADATPQAEGPRPLESLEERDAARRCRRSPLAGYSEAQGTHPRAIRIGERLLLESTEGFQRFTLAADEERQDRAGESAVAARLTTSTNGRGDCKMSRHSR